MEQEGVNYTNCNWYFWYSNKRIIKGTGGLGSWQLRGDHPNDNIIENGQKTEKSPGDLRRFAVPQTLVKDHQLMLMWKTLEEWNIVDFAVPADHRIKLKECEKRGKYLDLAWGMKKLWNMKVTIIPIVIGAYGTVTKGLLKGLEDLEVGNRVETIQTTALLKTARILRRVLETWGDFLSLKLQWKTISLRRCEKL